MPTPFASSLDSTSIRPSTSPPMIPAMASTMSRVVCKFHRLGGRLRFGGRQAEPSCPWPRNRAGPEDLLHTGRLFAGGSSRRLALRHSRRFARSSLFSVGWWVHHLVGSREKHRRRALRRRFG